MKNQTISGVLLFVLGAAGCASGGSKGSATADKPPEHHVTDVEPGDAADDEVTDDAAEPAPDGGTPGDEGAAGSEGRHCHRENIVAGVQQRYGTLKACYDQARSAGGGTPDKVRLDVRWIIELDGSVGSVGITDATHTDEALNGCVSRAVKRMKFLPPNGGVCVVNMPFNFEAD